MGAVRLGGRECLAGSPAVTGYRSADCSLSGELLLLEGMYPASCGGWITAWVLGDL